MTERAEREAGRRAKTARFDMQRKGRAVGVGETAGFIKVGVEARLIACSARPRPRTTASSI
jgi:pyruvate/2-oxoglutarate dehydrogenase complex dihydrolipoamide dehydrogenase (E3) component